MGGRGGASSRLRVIRLIALVGILVLGATLHDHGSTYTALGVVYFVIVAGTIGAMLFMRRGGGGPPGRRRPVGGPSAGGRWGAPPGGRPENTDPESDG